MSIGKSWILMKAVAEIKVFLSAVIPIDVVLKERRPIVVIFLCSKMRVMVDVSPCTSTLNYFYRFNTHLLETRLLKRTVGLS